MTRYLTYDELVLINQRVSQLNPHELVGVHDRDALKSIVESPGQSFFGREAYPTLYLKAAYYLQKFAKKHVFVNANKRTALIAAKLFLVLNGLLVDFADELEAARFVIDLAESSDTEKSMLRAAMFLKAHVSCSA